MPAGFQLHVVPVEIENPPPQRFRLCHGIHPSSLTRAIFFMGTGLDFDRLYAVPVEI